MLDVAITVERKIETRLEDDSGILEYFIRGTADEGAAKAALIAEAPAGHEGLTYLSASVEPIVLDEADPDACVWDGEVRYGRPSSRAVPPLEIGDVAISGEIGATTVHITLSLQNIGNYKADWVDFATDYAGLIGVNGDKVEGVDVEGAAWTFTVTKIFAVGSMPNLGAIFHLKCETPVNAESVTFTDTKTGLELTFAAGELLFRGVSFGRARNDDGVELVFSFAASPNLTDLSLESSIVVPLKKGHEYLWVDYTGAEAGGWYVMKPLAAHVEKVYELGAFAVLGCTA